MARKPSTPPVESIAVGRCVDLGGSATVTPHADAGGDRELPAGRKRRIDVDEIDGPRVFGHQSVERSEVVPDEQTGRSARVAETPPRLQGRVHGRSRHAPTFGVLPRPDDFGHEATSSRWGALVPGVPDSDRT